MVMLTVATAALVVKVLVMTPPLSHMQCRAPPSTPAMKRSASPTPAKQIAKEGRIDDWTRRRERMSGKWLLAMSEQEVTMTTSSTTSSCTRPAFGRRS